MADRLTPVRQQDPTAFGGNLWPHTPGATDLAESVPAGCAIKAVIFDADGTCDLINHNENAGVSGAVAGWPVMAGVPLPVIPKRITAMSGPTKCMLVTD